MSQDFILILKAFHPQFLLLTPVCFVLGVTLAGQIRDGTSYYAILLSFIGAIAAHISVNGFNEYLDYRSGLDEKTEKTPFSGGSGILQARPDLAPLVLAGSSIALVLSALVGLVFILETQSIWLFLFGFLGLLLIITYTPWLTHNPWACLVAPGIGFGLLITGGSAYVLSGQLTGATLVGMLIVFFLVNNLLLLNQYPDIDADKTVQREHFLIAYGIKKSTIVYGIFSAAPAILIIMAIQTHTFPFLTALGLLPLFLSPIAIYGAFRYGAQPERLIPFMGLNVGIVLTVPLLITIGLRLS